jgi:DNA-binding beta-propeller fold protein YncE
MFSVDGKQLITVSRDRAMKLTEVATGSFIDNVTSITPGVLGGGLQCLARHPKEDKFATGGEDGIPRMYKIVRTQARSIGDDNNLLRAFEKMPGVITAVAFSPDGARLLVASTAGEGRIYEIADGKRTATLSAGGAPLFAVAYRPDGQAVAVGGKDGLVRVFEVPGGKLLRQFVPVPLKESQSGPAGGQKRRIQAF